MGMNQFPGMDRPVLLKQKLESMTAEERIALIRVKVERANKHIIDLERAIRVFSDSDPHRVVTKPNPRNPQLGYSHVLTHMERIPTAIAAIAGDAIHNSRSVLDHLIGQMFFVGPTSAAGRNYDNFIITDTAKKFESRLNGVIKGLRPDAADALRCIEPYKGGKGHALWVLHELDIIDKHRLLMTVATRLSDIGIIPKNAPNAPPSPILGQPDRYLPLKTGDELLIVYGQFAKDLKFTFEIALNEPGVTQCQPLLETVQQLHDFVCSTFNILESHLR